MTIRKATAEDVASLVALYEAVWRPEVDALGEKLTHERCVDAETTLHYVTDYTYFVDEVDGQIVASLGCEEMHGTVHLVHLVVHPDQRRQGHAESLMRHAEEFARENGAVKVWFDTAPSLTAAMGLYDKLGYQKCGYLRRQYWNTDLVLYEKLL